MINVFYKNTGNAIGSQQTPNHIVETFEVKIDYEKTVKDLTAYEALRSDIEAVITKHCKPDDPDQTVIDTFEF